MSDVIHVDGPPAWQQILDHVEKNLTDEDRRRMNAEIGEALLKSIRTGSDRHVNRVVHAWLRTIVLIQHGVIDVLETEDALSREPKPISLDEWRARLSA